jgi:hypothetical protein
MSWSGIDIRSLGKSKSRCMKIEVTQRGEGQVVLLYIATANWIQKARARNRAGPTPEPHGEKHEVRREAIRHSE